jgi:uncharacterized lipoprotein NlpE involved in copper resistance
MKRSMKAMGKRIAGVAALALLALTVPGLSVAQEPVQCESDYVVQGGDWLAKIADRHYGHDALYPAIVLATNARSASDSSYATVADPWRIEPGWKLCLPGAQTAQSGFTVDALKNAEYLSEWTASGTAVLSDGQYEESIVPGAATKIVVLLSDRMAFGYASDGQPLAAVILITDPGGSGTFYDLALVLEQDGELANVAATFLGDRAKIRSLAVQDGQFVLEMVTHGPDDPMCCPTQRVRKTYALEGDQLVEIASQILGTESDEAPTSGQTRSIGIYKGWSRAASSPGIDSTLYLNDDGTLKLVNDYLNGEPPIVEVGTWQASGDGTLVLTIAGQQDRPYETPQVVALNLVGDVIATAEDEDAYGQLGRRWIRFDALARDGLALPYDAAAASRAVETSGFVGIYKAMLLAAVCYGRDITLYLLPDGTAQLKTDYLNNELPVVEIGTWEANGDGSLALTLTGQENRAYDAPKVITFEAIDGRLTAVEYDQSTYGTAGLELYHFDGLVAPGL